jgi:alkylation response protein AidB-like acyl-CoA dehydrogenase
MGVHMDFRFSKEEEAFREEVRQWLKEAIPPRWNEIDAGLWEETEESWALLRQFQRKLGQKG